MIGWQQDETLMNLGECHLPIDHGGETVQREPAAFVDQHPLNVFEARIEQLENVLNSATWDNYVPTVPAEAV